MAASGFNPAAMATTAATGGLGSFFPTTGGSFKNPIETGLAGILGGKLGNSAAPFNAGMQEFLKYFNQAGAYQNPFLNAGQNAIPGYQNWLQSMSNPSDFINKLMGQYQASPQSQYLQQQAMRAANNMGSASGLTGSTPLQMQAQQNAANISSQDMGNWLQNVLGINNQYGAGLSGLMGMGQGSANALTNLFAQGANTMGQGAYGAEAGRQADKMNQMGGWLSLLFG